MDFVYSCTLIQIAMKFVIIGPILNALQSLDIGNKDIFGFTFLKCCKMELMS